MKPAQEDRVLSENFLSAGDMKQEPEDIVVRMLLSEIIKREAGLALPIVTMLMVLGSLLVIPSLNYVATSLKAGENMENNIEGLYAADAGVEDALWRISNNSTGSIPYSYQLTGINGMTVDVVIDDLTTIAGEEMGTGGGHDDYLVIVKSITYDSGIYEYTMSMTNNGTGNMKIEKILIDFPPELDYVDGSTSGDITSEDPNITGNPTIGITLTWTEAPPYPTIPEDATRYHTFELSGPPDIAGVEGHGVVRATRQDVGTVWDSDSYPYSILAEAKDSTNDTVASIRAGVWAGVGVLEISCWQLSK